MAPFTHTKKAHGHPDHDALYARAAALGVPLAIHPTFEPFWAAPVRFKRIGRAREFFYNVMLRQGVQQALLSFIALGTLDRFPAPAARRPRVGRRAGSARSSIARTPWPRWGRAWRSG